MYRQTASFSQTLLWSGILASAAAVAAAQTPPTMLMQIDGNAATPELLAKAGPEELFREALAAVKTEAGLTEAERKN